MEPGDPADTTRPGLSFESLRPAPAPSRKETKAQKATAVKAAAERLAGNSLNLMNMVALRLGGPMAGLIPEERASIETALREVLEDSETFAEHSRKVSPFVLALAMGLWFLRIGTLWAMQKNKALASKSAVPNRATTQEADNLLRRAQQEINPAFLPNDKPFVPPGQGWLTPDNEPNPARIAPTWEPPSDLFAAVAEPTPTILPDTELFHNGLSEPEN